MRQDGTLKTVVVLLIGITAISFAAIFIKFCDDVPAVMIATYRLVIASACLLVYFRIRGCSFSTLTRRDLLLSFLGGLFLALHFITWITSLKYTSVASSVVLVTTNPIFVGVFSALVLRERQQGTLVAGIILCVAGSAFIALGDGGFRALDFGDGRAVLGDVLALMGAVMASGYLIVGSAVRERLDNLTYITIVFSISAAVLLAVSLVCSIPFTGYRPSSYLFMALLAVVPQLIGHTAFNWALRHIRAGMIAITILGEPVGATLLAYTLLGEPISGFQGMGMVLIFAAIIIASRRGGKSLSA